MTGPLVGRTFPMNKSPMIASRLIVIVRPKNSLNTDLCAILPPQCDRLTREHSMFQTCEGIMKVCGKSDESTGEIEGGQYQIVWLIP